MGSWFSSPNSETKTVESDGAVNNNVVIQGEPLGYEFEIMVLLSIICAIKIFEILLFVYKKHTKTVKQNYERSLKTGSV